MTKSISSNDVGQRVFICSTANYVLEKGLTITLLVVAILGATGTLKPTYYIYTVIGLSAGLAATKIISCRLYKQGGSCLSKLNLLVALALTILVAAKPSTFISLPWPTYAMIGSIILNNFFLYHNLYFLNKKINDYNSFLHQVVEKQNVISKEDLKNLYISLNTISEDFKELHSFEYILMTNYFSEKTALGSDRLSQLVSRIRDG